MDSGVWIAIVTAVQAISLGLIGKIAVDGSKSRKQVENDHENNLRDNIDDNHDQTLYAVTNVNKLVTELKRIISGIQKDVGRLYDRDLQDNARNDRINKKIDDIDDKLDTHLQQTTQKLSRIDAIERHINGH